jgi:short-subunit dehydrogenase
MRSYKRIYAYVNRRNTKENGMSRPAARGTALVTGASGGIGVYGAGKAFVIASSNSLQHELADKGIRIQAVLPGATATEIWELAGLPYQNLPPETVMSPEDAVDAAMAGLDQGELVTIPPLQDADEWTRFEASRRALSPRFRNSVPAPRYRTGALADQPA